MQDFAALLLTAREKAGMTQAQVAVAAGLTPSYLSFIENRKKPPPSDEVCQRLAEVLDISAKRLVEVAHLERAPATVKRRVRSLRTSLNRERRSRRRLLESLLSPFLFKGPPGYLESALDTVGISKTRRRRLREVLAAVGRRHQDRADRIAKIVEDLPEKDRELLLQALPQLLGEQATTSSEDRRPALSRPASDPPGAPQLLYAPPPPDAPPVPYLLEVGNTTATGSLDLQPGDVLLVDPALAPRPGDWVVLRGAEDAVLRRLDSQRDDHFRLVGSDAEPSDLLDASALAARLAEVGAGTVVELRRRLRENAPDDRSHR